MKGVIKGLRLSPEENFMSEITSSQKLHNLFKKAGQLSTESIVHDKKYPTETFSVGNYLEGSVKSTIAPLTRPNLSAEPAFISRTY